MVLLIAVVVTATACGSGSAQSGSNPQVQQGCSKVWAAGWQTWANRVGMPIWCPGCGDFGVLASLYRAFAELDLDPARTVVVSGIDCSSRLPGFVTT